MGSEPRPGAVVITRDQTGVFALCDSTGVPQIICDSFQELLQLAVHFTSDKRAHLWYPGLDGGYRPVGDAALLQRVWAGFLDYPTRSVNFEQARTLWGADPDAGRAALDALVALRLAAHNGDGEYAPLSAAI